MPPPKSRRTPQSVFLTIPCQLIKPHTGSNTTAHKAIRASIDGIPPGTRPEIKPLNIQHRAMTVKTPSTRFCLASRLPCPATALASTTSSGDLIFRERQGLSITHINAKTTTEKTQATGTPILSQSANPMCNSRAAIALGGEPTKVPIPPMEAL